MFKGSSINLINANVTDKLSAGRIELPKGKAMRGLRMKVTCGIENTRAGGVTTALTTTQRKDLLANLQFGLKWGHQQQHQPFKAFSGARARLLQRYCYGSEMEGYSNSTTGLARALTNGATSTVVFYLTIPVGAFYQHKARRNFRGVGRSQAATMEVEAKFISRTFTSDVLLQLDGNVTLEVVPDVFRCKGDHWTPIAGWTEYSEKDRFFKKEAGLPLLVVETSAAHASSTLSNVSVYIDGETIHDQVSAAEILIEYLDNPELLSEGDVSDEVTILYCVQPGEEIEELSTGEVRVTQNVQDLSTASYGIYEMPIIPQEAMDRDVEAAAVLRNKNVKAVSLAAVQGWLEKLPNRLAPYVPAVILDQDDVEFERFPGKVCAPRGKAVTAVPATVLANARDMVAAYKGRGEVKTAAGVVQKLAAAIPGAVQAPRGFAGGGSRALLDVSASVES
jgi:hypothetical protein